MSHQNNANLQKLAVSSFAKI